MPFAGPSHIMFVMGLQNCFGRSDLVGDLAHGLGSPGSVGPNLCLAAGLLLQGVRHPVLGNAPEHAPGFLRRTCSGHVTVQPVW